MHHAALVRFVSFRISTLIKQLTTLVEMVEKHPPLAFYPTIDRYYYLQKVTELKLLQDAMLAGRLGLEEVASQYVVVFIRWRRDTRWLSRKITSPHDPKPVV